MEQHFRDVDWVEAHERLTLAAYRLFAAAGFVGEGHVLASFGVGPEDFANEVLCALLDPDNPKVTWNSAVRGVPATREVVGYLVTVMRNDFRDKVRAKRRKRQDSLYAPTQDEDVQLRVEPEDPAEDVETALVERSHRQPLRKRLDDDFLVRPDDELQLYLMLQFDGDRYVPFPPRDAAVELGITVERVYLLKEKFERRLLRVFKAELQAAETRENGMRTYGQEAR